MRVDNAQVIFEYTYHENNFLMANLLMAGRSAEEKMRQE
jgi:hypothetical protein